MQVRLLGLMHCTVHRHTPVAAIVHTSLAHVNSTTVMPHVTSLASVTNNTHTTAFKHNRLEAQSDLPKWLHCRARDMVPQPNIQSARMVVTTSATGS